MQPKLKTYNYFVYTMNSLPEEHREELLEGMTLQEAFNHFWENTPHADQIEYQKKANYARIEAQK